MKNTSTILLLSVLSLPLAACGVSREEITSAAEAESEDPAAVGSLQGMSSQNEALNLNIACGSEKGTDGVRAFDANAVVRVSGPWMNGPSSVVAGASTSQKVRRATVSIRMSYKRNNQSILAEEFPADAFLVKETRRGTSPRYTDEGRQVGNYSWTQHYTYVLFQHNNVIFKLYANAWSQATSYAPTYDGKNRDYENFASLCSGVPKLD